VLAEPVSPELVLVDPELARRERAKLEERAQLLAIHQADDLRRALERTAELPPPREPEPVATTSRVAASGRRVLAAALFCSLLANGFFVAKLVTRTDEAARTAAAVVPPSLVTTGDQNATSPQGVPPRPAKGLTPAQSKLETKAAVERKIASLILSAPPHKLPKAFIDPTTGIIRNNVQVTCRLATKRRFHCTITPPSPASPNASLFVRYRVRDNGSGVFYWSK
jgi:hypothetical protein